MLKIFSFSKKASLKDPKDFKIIKRKGIKFSTSIFYCYWNPSPHQLSRIGVTISKRQVKLAVRRNKIKRRIKEWFRIHQDDLPGGDFVFIVTQRALDKNAQEIFNTLDSFHQKLKKRCNITA